MGFQNFSKSCIRFRSLELHKVLEAFEEEKWGCRLQRVSGVSGAFQRFSRVFMRVLGFFRGFQGLSRDPRAFQKCSGGFQGVPWGFRDIPACFGGFQE